MLSPLPENEAGRVEALQSYRILDTPPEERFDDLARLVAYVCGTPIGLIGLIDSSREWFKSRVGWDVSGVAGSLLHHTILEHDGTIVSHHKDKRFAKSAYLPAGVVSMRGPLLTIEKTRWEHCA
jgi:hypothetical protein